MSTNPVFAIAQAKHDVLVSQLPRPTSGAVMPHQVPNQARLLALDYVFSPHLPHHTAPHAIEAVVQPRVHAPVQARRYVEVAKTEAFHDVMASAAHRGLDVADQPITGPMEVSLAAKKTLYKKLLGF